ncbi:hypothetical protein NPIL_160701 [Nephila pilipes]|uniref:Uncharacterized protein n=1 Tax=Nephila pilipes TaxID=299642 RepID=A0A8X6MQP4_NEPPI|nr:hypothetical protein NPIL_160701 [Nephila pilipes]
MTHVVIVIEIPHESGPIHAKIKKIRKALLDVREVKRENEKICMLVKSQAPREIQKLQEERKKTLYNKREKKYLQAERSLSADQMNQFEKRTATEA